MAFTPPFSDNLRLALKLLSISAAKLASGLEVDKSVVSRWLNGSVQPSAHNLSRLSALIAARVEGFTVLDWERTPESLAELFGVDPAAITSLRGPQPAGAIPIAIWDELTTTAQSRGAAYEGFFRSTRPHPRLVGRFLHEWSMVRRDAVGLLRLSMGSADSKVDGWMLPLHGLVYSIAAEINSGTLTFGIFNGIGAARVDVLDGIALLPANDMGRSPLANCILSERIGDLSGDREADDRFYAGISGQNPVAPIGSVPEHIQAHLVRDIGPEQVTKGGDWLLTMSLMRTMTRGPDFDTAPAS